MMLRCLTLLFCISLFGSLSAQSGRQHRALYNLDGGNYQNKGWFVSPGITYMFPSSNGRDDIRLRAETEGPLDTIYVGEFTDNGRVGFYLEVGRHHFTDAIYGLDYIDYGIGFKQLRGRERFTGRMLGDNGMEAVENDGQFSQGRLTGFFNASNILQLSDASFLQNSLGINLDYRLINTVDYVGPTTGMNQVFPEDFTFDFHWKIGFGWKPQNGLFIIPSVETPILSVVPLDDGKSTVQLFSTRYRPVIFTLRFLWFQKRKGQDCVGSSAGDKHYDLFGRDVKKKRRRK